MNKVDWNAVDRRIACAEQEMADTRQWIADAESDRYSPLMSSEAFEAQFHRAVAATGLDEGSICIFGIARPHRCSRCDDFVRAFMEKQKSVTANG